jgi:dynein heavy chain
MNYMTMADIFKGLAQTGAWGCFDEFNRIMIEVLSVVATQVKQVLDAAVLYSVPANREAQYQHLPPGSPPNVVGTFELNGDTIKIIPTVGMFITMNPGYAGRTELPENLKALFRSCAMIRPDLALICENMLMSEGFQSARPLSIKFVTLYELSSALLSPQAHYDWGLRSVKSVLRVAGSLKRMDKDIAEDGILMRALRDFNTPKMPLSDLPIFLRLIQDLFPKYYGLATKLSVKIQQNSIQACKEAKPQLQSDHVFVSKVVQLQELMDVRHSVMLLGPGGCGKTTVWKTLCAGHNLGLPPTKAVAIYNVVDPKAITSDELYGYMTLAKEWKDGCLSIIMRGMSKNNKELGYVPTQTFKWAVLDGDIDAVWIESMNTVMDDNKMLTLVSNERIPLSAAMRMVFEINSLANATPATVSRAGILYINESDIGWRPMVETWLQATKMDELIRLALPGLFDKYVEVLGTSFEFKRLKSSIPIMLISQVTTVIRLLEGFMEKIGKDCRRPIAEVLEQHFFLAVAWAFGGALTVESSEGARGDHRRTFHDMMLGLSANAVKLPKIEGKEDALLFDFFFDPETEDFRLWSDVVSKYVVVPIGSNAGEQSFASLVVPTVDSTRLTSLAQQLTLRGYPVMFVGTAGTGKTTLVKTYLASLSMTSDTLLTNTITMNYYMDSLALQGRIDANIDKRSGKVFGPPNGKKLILYIDDFNLPYIETYGTQNSLSLLRQIIDHKIYYDRIDLGYRKEVADLQFMASMNPTAGSFTVTERLQRNFSTFSCLMPSDGDLGLVYKSILTGHLVTQGFSVDTQGVAEGIVAASIRLLRVVISEFLPDAERFMYNWNMRELANVFQGLTLARSEMYPLPVKMVRLWIHEAFRVFSDRMVDLGDYNKFDAKIRVVAKAVFKDLDQEALFEGPIIFTNFAAQPGAGGDPTYIPLPAGEKGMELLSKTLMEKLEDYNSSHSIMDLVLFEQAMEHVCRIARIISNPGGHALLVGVGGSGKQSLSKLSAHICNYEVKQLAVTSRFTVNDLKDALKAMYVTTGVKGNGLVFLLTDSQIVNDKFLVCINDILSSGWISDLFERDEIDQMFNSIRNDAKAAGVLIDDPAEMLKFFLSKVRANLHLILCFSPVGATFRVRARRFPGLINCSAIDKFHPWPRDALYSVGAKFLKDVEGINTDAIREGIEKFMPYSFQTVNNAAVKYLSTDRRFVYTTPKSFLELLKLYQGLLKAKRLQSENAINRLANGLQKLRDTGEVVAKIEEELKGKLMRLDSNHRKLTRFFLDLRQELVNGFFCSSQPVLHFAVRCKQGYLIA